MKICEVKTDRTTKEIDKFTVILRDFNTSLNSRTRMQKINIKWEDFSNHDQRDLTDLYNTAHSKSGIHFQVHTNHLPRQIIFLPIKQISENSKKIPAIQSMLWDHNGNKLEFSNLKVLGKFPNSSKLNNVLLNHPFIKEEVKREMRNYFGLYENGNTTYKNL